MKIDSLYIKNFKSISELKINEVDNALILVGKNNTGKTTVLDAILAVSGDYKIKESDFNQKDKPIIIGGVLGISENDLEYYHKQGLVSKFKKYDLWEKDFMSKLPNYKEGKVFFECIITREGKIRYFDGIKKNNLYIQQIFPKVYYVDHSRNIIEFQEDLLERQGRETLGELRDNVCMFDTARPCNRCFQCIGLINKKTPSELNVYETTRLLEYKLLNMNLSGFANKLNENFKKNGNGRQEVSYALDFNVDNIFKVKTLVYDKERNSTGNIEDLSEGFKSIYILSLLETYIELADKNLSSIIMIEDPEMFLHPQLQKVASEILYSLSKKNQIVFSTHSPNMIFNFSQKQIKQVVLDEKYSTVVNEDEEIDKILDDLGYTANDLMNVSFVFIVEGKQDGARLPLLLEKYYSEMYDDSGKLQRIAIIPTNSCTNIKTYANLKYINKLYLKDQFLMIRDSDGKNPETLAKQLCSYYADRSAQDINNLPRVTKRNVLILKYYSFENYFLNPEIMTKIGVIKNQEEFYNTLYAKWKEYLSKMGSSKRMIKALGIRINNKKDLVDNIENIKIYVRGHNLFDIFYSKYKGPKKDEILKKYVDIAPRECFGDILEAIDNFVYFENRKKD